MAAATPTIVLVHGAWADATGFDAELRALQARGFRAIGFGNPLRDLAGDAAYLAEFLRSLTGPIVLVGHSYGGNVISMAAVGNDQVQALVYFNGWMCDEGDGHRPAPLAPPASRARHPANDWPLGLSSGRCEHG
jgi:pimeloyl-ACP methyl ester carboxylesterase